MTDAVPEAGSPAGATLDEDIRDVFLDCGLDRHGLRAAPGDGRPRAARAAVPAVPQLAASIRRSRATSSSSTSSTQMSREEKDLAIERIQTPVDTRLDDAAAAVPVAERGRPRADDRGAEEVATVDPLASKRGVLASDRSAAGHARLRPLGPRRCVLEAARRGFADRAGRPPRDMGPRRVRLDGVRVRSTAGAVGCAARRAARRRDARVGDAARDQLVHLRVGDDQRPPARREPRLLHQPAGLGCARNTGPRRTAAPSPVGCDRDRDDGSRAARVSSRPRAVDRLNAGGELRPLRGSSARRRASRHWSARRSRRCS